MLEIATVNTDNPLYEELVGTDPIVSWILPGFIPQGVLFAIAGAPGSGKSYLFYTMGLALAAGMPILGMTPDRPFRVLYFDEENSTPDRVQYERWAWHGLGRPNLNLILQNFWCCSFGLGSVDWYKRAEEEILLHKPDLFIIDTTTPACHIQDENSNAEAHAVIGKIRVLQNLMPVPITAVALKHARLNSVEGGGYTLRGAKAWEGAVDGIVYISKSRGRPRGDGLSNNILSPSKTRAFGLRKTIRIAPKMTKDGLGMTLTVDSSEIEE